MATASSTTADCPQWMASSVASRVATTEAKPLIPQAQGTSGAAPAATAASPNGNGMPRQKANGATSSIVSRIFQPCASPMASVNSEGSSQA